MSRFKNLFGPSTLIAAAFIGPGTVTICTLAGAQFGYNLLWALLFSVFATIVLQEMAARVGLITQKGLGELVHQDVTSVIVKTAFIAIIFSAIVIGNAAYEAGNISGAVLGAELILDQKNILTIIIFIVAFAVLYIGKYKIIEKFLIGLVLVMSLCFLASLFVVKLNVAEVAKGFVPQFPDSAELILILGLIGTTVVPYNLFLHASSVSEKYKKAEELPLLRKENLVAIVLGGFVSMCILILAAATLYTKGIEVSSAKEMALQLEPLFGSFAKYAIGIGLFAAGISSAITAPLAAAHAANGLFNWNTGLKDLKFRIVWAAVLIIGFTFSMTNFKAIVIIKFAQVANGFLLPIIAMYLLYVVNKKKILGAYVNSKIQNILAAVVILITILIAYRGLIKVFG